MERSLETEIRPLCDNHIKGNVGQVSVALDLIKRGFDVFTPMNEMTTIDLAFCRTNRDRLEKVQVKSVTPVSNKIIVPLASCSGSKKYHYALGEIDWIAVYITTSEDILYIKYHEVVQNKRSISIRLCGGRPNGSRKISDYKNI